MQLHDVHFKGPPIDDPEILRVIPKSLASLLSGVNGYTQFSGAFHLRGACLEPAWHSLRVAWMGDHSFAKLYPGLSPRWIPFAEDCMGDQFLMTEQGIARLDAETGEVFQEAESLAVFLEEVNEDPVPTLALEEFESFLDGGGVLEPGKLLQAYPPMWTAESASGVTLTPLPAADLHRTHAALAKNIRDNGGKGAIRFQD